MMSEDDLAAADRIHDVINQEAAAFGPTEEDEDDDELERPVDGAILEEWVLVMSWRDLETGRTYMTRATSRNLARHHENGLLHEALYNFD